MCRRLLKEKVNFLNFKVLNPFQCGSLGCAHRTAWGPKGQTKLGFSALCRLERICTSPHRCGPIADAPLVLLLIWACKRCFLTPPPPIISVATQSRGKIGYGTRIHTAFLAWRLHFMTKFTKGVKKSLDKAFLQFLKFKIIFTNNKVKAL